jgi:tetratricopeptide (TPR) repeat protein
MFLAVQTKLWALMKTGQVEEAAKGTDSALELYEKYFLRLGPGTYAAMAQMCIKAGRLDQAERLLERSLAAKGGVLHEAEALCIQGELYLTRARLRSSANDLELAERTLRKSFLLARQRLQVLRAQEVVSHLVPLLESQGWHLEAAEVEIEMQRLREDAAARAEKILAETGSQMSRLDDGTGSFAAKSRAVGAK